MTGGEGDRSLGRQVADLARRVIGAPPAAPPPAAVPDTCPDPDCALPWADHETAPELQSSPPAAGGDVAAAFIVDDPLPQDGGEGRPRPQAAADAWFRSLHVRQYADDVSTLIARLAQITPERPDRFGEVNATTSLTLAVAALRLAAEQVEPPADAYRFVEPDKLRTLIGALGEAQTAFADVVAQVHKQLVALRRAAQQNDVAGPPGSDPTSEVDAVTLDMIDVERALGIRGVGGCASAADRLARLRRTRDRLAGNRE